MNNTIQANQLLAQMRALQAQAGIEQPQAKQGLNQTQNVDFASVLQQSVEAVNNQSKKASSLAQAMTAITASNPKEHRDWLQQQQKK